MNSDLVILICFGFRYSDLRPSAEGTEGNGSDHGNGVRNATSELQIYASRMTVLEPSYW